MSDLISRIQQIESWEDPDLARTRSTGQSITLHFDNGCIVHLRQKNDMTIGVSVSPLSYRGSPFMSVRSKNKPSPISLELRKVEKEAVPEYVKLSEELGIKKVCLTKTIYIQRFEKFVKSIRHKEKLNSEPLPGDLLLVPSTHDASLACTDVFDLIPDLYLMEEGPQEAYLHYFIFEDGAALIPGRLNGDPDTLLAQKQIYSKGVTVMRRMVSPLLGSDPYVPTKMYLTLGPSNQRLQDLHAHLTEIYQRFYHFEEELKQALPELKEYLKLEEKLIFDESRQRNSTTAGQ